MGTGNQRLNRTRQPQGEQVSDQEQDQDHAGEERGHLDRRLDAGVDHAFPRESDSQVALEMLAQVEVGELEFIRLVTDGQRPRCRTARRGKRQVGAQVLVDQVAIDPRQRARQHAPVAIEQRDLRL